MDQEWYDQLRIDVCNASQNCCFVLTRDELYFVLSQRKPAERKMTCICGSDVDLTASLPVESEGGHCD